MTTETARRAILESIANTRDVIEQARLEGAALRGELGVQAQILAMSEVYKTLKAQGRDAEAAAVKAEAYRIQAAAVEAERADLATDMAIPPTDDILMVVKERYDVARLHEDTPGARQLDRVRQNLLRGAHLSWHAGDLLIQSVNTPGAVYSVNRAGCTCPNGAAGKAQCWHVALYDLLLEMQEDRAAVADDDAGESGPIVVTASDAGLTLSRGDDTIACREAADVAAAITALTRRPVDLGRRLAQARACHAVAA